MLEQHPIDALRFARGRERLEGSLAIADLARLADLVSDKEGRVDYVVTGDIDDRGRPSLLVAVRGVVAVTCQRCLGRYDHALDVESRLILASSEAEMPEPADEEDDADWIDGREALEVADLVEQEVVLALPFAPLHDEEQCAVHVVGPAGPVGEAKKPSPFAVLATLKPAGTGTAKDDS
jgi:uncharacterized protein